MGTSVTSSIETKTINPKPVVKKTRKRKKKGKNYYFNQGTEDAIILYNKSTIPHERNKIYNEHIRKPFDKLAENIIHTFKFYYFDVGSIEVKHEVVSFLVMNIHKFQEGKGKAFSYFSIVAKNYLILHNNKNYKHYKIHDKMEVLDYGDSLTNEKNEYDTAQFNEQYVTEMLD